MWLVVSPKLTVVNPDTPSAASRATPVRCQWRAFRLGASASTATGLVARSGVQPG